MIRDLHIVLDTETEIQIKQKTLTIRRYRILRLDVMTADYAPGTEDSVRAQVRAGVAEAIRRSCRACSGVFISSSISCC